MALFRKQAGEHAERLAAHQGIRARAERRRGAPPVAVLGDRLARLADHPVALASAADLD